MKRFLLIVSAICLAFNLFSQAPSFLWAKRIGGTGNDEALSIFVDASGNIYTAGRFQNTVDFDPGAGVYNLTSVGLFDIFISKLDASGNFLWARAMGSANEDQGNSVVVDASGDVYTAGYFEGTIDFDPGTGVSNLVSAGGFDIFILKLDSAGNFVWAKRMGGSINEAAISMAIDPTSGANVYTTGYFAGTADFDPGTGTYNLVSSGARNIFISKLDTSGSFVWAKSLGGTGDDYGYSIAIDPGAGGDVCTSGYFNGTADFDPGTGIFNITSAGGKDIFISKVDVNGNFVWAKAIGSTGDDEGRSIAVDPTSGGSIYTTGDFSGTVDFDPDSLGVNSLIAAGNSDIFISKLDSAGHFVWAKAMGGTAYDAGYSIVVDPISGGSVYTTGYFGGTSDFDPGGGTFNLISAGGRNIFISKLDASGNFVWAKSAGGTGFDYGYSATVNISGNLYLTGYFYSNSIAFGATILTSAGATGTGDIYITKLDIITGVESEDISHCIRVFPNPSGSLFGIHFNISEKESISVKIYDITGRLVNTLIESVFDPGTYKLQWNATYEEAGMYFVTVASEKSVITKKVVLE